MKNEIFKANPNLDLYYQTSDGEPFFTENAAQNHAKGLKNKSVTPVYRSDADESDETEEEENVNIAGIEVTAEIVSPGLKVVNTDPFDPATFPNRVMTTEQTAPVVTTEPVETKEPVVTTAPVTTEPATTAPDAPVKTEVKEETKTVEAKTTKK